jgi:hypothetical protein
MIDGYKDGFDHNSPDPSGNRSASYLHGFANGRDDLRRKPRADYKTLVAMADAAMAKDEAR